MHTLKLGHIGAGFVSQFHARALEQVRQVELAGINSLAESMKPLMQPKR